MKKKKIPLVICYHGTTRECAEIIRAKGFAKNAPFTTTLEDALEFGGKYVFGVAFETKSVPKIWAFKISKKKSVKDIVFLNKYEKEVIVSNVDLMDKIFESNI